MPQIHELETSTGTLGSGEYFAIDNGTTTKKIAGSTVKNAILSDSDMTSTIVDTVYPVGSIYMSVNSTSPASLFGGTWTRIEGKFLLAADSNYTAGSDGGFDEITLSEDYLPQITGTIKFASNLARNDTGASSILESANGKFSRVSSSSQNAVKATNTSVDTGKTLYTSARFQFGSLSPTPVPLIPPYLAVYMWQRTA